jgi:4-amino-4-deoxy-L-arabinose transferase-like glycosyltransferase
MNTTLTKQLLIALGAAILFIPFLGQAHLFDWDEVNFAEAAREMIVSGQYSRVQIDFQPFWEKPPLFIWMQVLCMKVLGINEFTARLPNALMGIATLCTLFHVGRKVVNERMAWWWVLLYAGSWLPAFYFKSAIIDPTFNLFIFVAFYQVYLMRFGTRKLLHSLAAGFFLGLAVLTKGPVALLIALLCLIVFLIVNKGLWGYGIKYFLYVAAAAAVTAFSWFGVDIIQNGWWFTETFITYQIRLFQTEDAGHGGPFFYHFLVLLIGCFPAAAFLFQTAKPGTNSYSKKEEQAFSIWMWILFLVVLVLFSIVKTKIVHYSSLCYFPLTFLAAYRLSAIDEGKESIKKIVPILIGITGGIIALLLLLLPIIGMNKSKLTPYIQDEFAVANLEAYVPWSLAECFYGLLMAASIVISLLYIRKNFTKSLLWLLVSQIIIIQVAIAHFTPKIEAYSQRAAVEFFQSLSGKDVYLQTLDYKSYSYLFYSNKQPSTNPAYYKDKLDWMLYGVVDKPCYFISKITSEAQWSAHPNLEKIGAKNGFVFYKRK